MSRIFGNTVAIDGAEVNSEVRIDGGEVTMSDMTGGDLGVFYRVGGGTMFHERLQNRDLPDQHPIGAVTNLEAELEVRPDEMLTNMEIHEILNH